MFCLSAEILLWFVAQPFCDLTNFFRLIIDARQIDKFSADLIFVLTVLWFGQLNIGIALY